MDPPDAVAVLVASVAAGPVRSATTSSRGVWWPAATTAAYVHVTVAPPVAQIQPLPRGTDQRHVLRQRVGDHDRGRRGVGSVVGDHDPEGDPPAVLADDALVDRAASRAVSRRTGSVALLLAGSRSSAGEEIPAVLMTDG